MEAGHPARPNGRETPVLHHFFSPLFLMRPYVMFSSSEQIAYTKTSP